jgi:hypothetical protein
MRTWFLHPIAFYPLVAVLAALVIAVSVKPLEWPREAAAVAGERVGSGIVLAGPAFATPAPDRQQNLYVSRNFLGQPRALRIAVAPNQAAPGLNDRGVRILLTPEAAAELNGRPVTIVVTYNPLAVNAATGLAVSLEGAGPTQWISETAPPQHLALRFEAPAQTAITAIGLRTINANREQPEAYGLEITRISITPHPQTAVAH